MGEYYCPEISATAKFKLQNHFFVCLLPGLIVTGTWVLHEVTQDFSPRIQRIRIKSSVYTITKTYACWFSILIEFLYKSCQTMDSAVFEFLVEIRPGRYSLEFLVGVCAPSSPNPDPILDQKIYFSHRFHT